MRNFQAGHMTSFPSTSIPPSFGNLSTQAYASLPLTVDSIQQRSLGHSRFDQRARIALARPAPTAPAKGTRRPAKTCKISIWIPCRMSPPMPYKRDNVNLTMKKILQFRVLPIEVSLPGDTLWGGVYNGAAFSPGSSQFEIAKHCSEALSSNNRSNPEWASMSGCFFSKTPKGQHRPKSKFTGGASLEPLFYPSSTRWNFLPKKSMVYIPNPAVQMTTQQIAMYKKAAADYETPMGMDLLEDGALGEAATGGDQESETSVQDVQSNIQIQNDDNVNRVLGSNVAGCSYQTPQGDRVDPFQGDLDQSDASLEITAPESASASQGFTTVHRSIKSRETTLRDNGVEHHLPISTFVCDISSDDDDFVPLPRRSTRGRSNMEIDDSFVSIPRRSTQTQRNLGTWPRTLEYRNQESLYDVEGDDSMRIHTELLQSWLLASQEVQSLISKYKGPIEENVSDLNMTLVVDLGDLAAQFWESFDAACLEDSDSAEEVLDDLNLLTARKLQCLGLTREMLDIRVPRILHHVESLKPYNKNNVEMFFNKSAMPNWCLWEELMVVLDRETVDMHSVEENENWLFKLIDQAPDTLSKRKFSESLLLSLRKEFMEWRALDALLVRKRLDKTEEEYEILTAKKKEQHALHQLTVFDISYSKLTEFRKFHKRAPKLFIEVSQGGELTAIREMCKGVLDRRVIFGDFFVKYTTVTNNYSLREHSAIDAGGLTDRLLTQAWSIIFNSSGEFHSVFEKGDTINHLSSNVPDSPHVQNDIILVGQLMFLLILKKQRVTREITMATIAMAMGKEPDRASISHALEKDEDDIYLRDYKEFHPKDYKLMEFLMKGGLDAAGEALELINTNMTDYCLKFGSLRTDLGEIRFQSDVRAIIVEIIYNTLFVRCSGVGKYLKEGFFSLVNTIITSSTVSEAEKKELLTKTLGGVEVSAMSTFFSAEQAVTSEEFLSRVDYENRFPEDLKSIFIEAVKGFTSPETYRLYAFITDEKFNRGTRCHIKYSRVLSEDYLPIASTCSKTLELPHYQNVKTMIQKLSLATHSLDYGHA